MAQRTVTRFCTCSTSSLAQARQLLGRYRLTLLQQTERQVSECLLGKARVSPALIRGLRLYVVLGKCWPDVAGKERETGDRLYKVVRALLQIGAKNITEYSKYAELLAHFYRLLVPDFFNPNEILCHCLQVRAMQIKSLLHNGAGPGTPEAKKLFAEFSSLLVLSGLSCPVRKEEAARLPGDTPEHALWAIIILEQDRLAFPPDPARLQGGLQQCWRQQETGRARSLVLSSMLKSIATLLAGIHGGGPVTAELMLVLQKDFRHAIQTAGFLNLERVVVLVRSLQLHQLHILLPGNYRKVPAWQDSFDQVLALYTALSLSPVETVFSGIKPDRECRREHRPRIQTAASPGARQAWYSLFRSENSSHLQRLLCTGGLSQADQQESPDKGRQGDSNILDDAMITAFYKLRANCLELDNVSVGNLLAGCDRILHWHWCRQLALMPDLRERLMGCLELVVARAGKMDTTPDGEMTALESLLVDDVLITCSEQNDVLRSSAASVLPGQLAERLECLLSVRPGDFLKQEKLQARLDNLLSDLYFLEATAAGLRIPPIEALAGALIEVLQESAPDFRGTLPYPGQLLHDAYQSLLGMLNRAAAWQKVTTADVPVRALQSWVDKTSPPAADTGAAEVIDFTAMVPVLKQRCRQLMRILHCRARLHICSRQVPIEPACYLWLLPTLEEIVHFILMHVLSRKTARRRAGLPLLSEIAFRLDRRQDEWILSVTENTPYRHYNQLLYRQLVRNAGAGRLRATLSSSGACFELCLGRCGDIAWSED